MHCTHEGPQAEKMADTQPEKMGEKPEKDRKQAAQYIGTKPKRVGQAAVSARNSP